MVKVNGTKTMEIKPDQALTDKQQHGVVKVLKVLLADESVLYTKLRNYHWNVSGADFYPLHDVFENQLNEIAIVIDDAAERIRQYGANAPGTMDEFIKKTRLVEEPGVYPDARTMVANLLADHESIIRFAREDITKIDDRSGDVGTIDFLTSLLQQHQKMAWKLRMYLES